MTDQRVHTASRALTTAQERERLAAEEEIVGSDLQAIFEPGWKAAYHPGDRRATAHYLERLMPLAELRGTTGSTEGILWRRVRTEVGNETDNG